MATQKAVVLLCLLAIFASGSHAQFGLFRPSTPPPPPGAGRSVQDVVCSLQDFSTLCQLIRAAAKDPTVAELTDPTYTATVFIPNNKAIEDTRRQLTSKLGVTSVNDLTKQPKLAARVLANHIITGQVLQYGQLKNGQKFVNAAGQTLTIDSGALPAEYTKNLRDMYASCRSTELRMVVGVCDLAQHSYEQERDPLCIKGRLLGGLYVKGPVNTVKISSQGGQNNIPAARAVLHTVDGVLVPK